MGTVAECRSWESRHAAPTRGRGAIALGLLSYLLGVAFASLQPGPRLWGLHLPGFLPNPFGLAYWIGMLCALGLIVAGVVVGARDGKAPILEWNMPEKRRRRWRLVGFLVISGSAFWLLRTRTHFLGDSALWLSGLQRGEPLEGHEPLAEAIWRAMASALRSAGAEITAATVAPLSVACGLIAAVLTWKLAREISKDTGRFGLALVSLATLGSSVLFFGYIESYPPVAVAILWFLYAGVRNSRSESALLLPAVALSVAIAAHLACVYLAPAYIYLVLRTRQSMARRLLHLAAPACLTTALLLGLGFGPSRWEETVRIAALGVSQPIASATPQDARPYPVVSVDHALDLGNEVLLVIPIPLLLLIGSIVARPRDQSDRSGGTNAFLSVGATSGVAILAALVLPITYAQDWDLFALFLIPAGVLGVRRGVPLGMGRGGPLVTAGIQLAGACALGAFVLVNAIPDAGLRRFETLVGPGAKVTPLARMYAHEVLAYYHRHLGDPRAALAHAEALLKEEPTNHRLWAMVGTIRYSQGDFSGAIPYLEEAVARGRQVADTWTNLGICYSHQGRHADALALFLKAVDRAPNRPDYQVNLALSLLNAGQADSARTVLLRTVRRWPSYEPAHSALARHFPGR